MYKKLSLLLIFAVSCAAFAEPARYTVKTEGLTVTLSPDGNILDMEVAGKRCAITGGTALAGLPQQGAAIAQSANNACRFTRTMADGQGHSAKVTDRFTPTKDSIRWEVEITSDDAPWSTAIETRLNYPATPESRFWTTWGSSVVSQRRVWTDPLIPVPFAARTLNYQFSYILKYWSVPMVQSSGISMPLCSMLEPSRDAALSLFLSPEDTLLDITLAESPDGAVTFARTKHRLGEGKSRRFAMDLVAHPADPRAALGWMVARYPQCFNPANPYAHELSGHGAYSGCEDKIDAAKFHKMAFAFNWKLSDDFPYIGNYIPVATPDEQWTRSCAEQAAPGKGRETSCKQLNAYAQYMKDNGFHVLSYFNVTEYGKNMPWPAPARKAQADSDLWKDPADFFFYGGLRSAVLMAGGKPRRSNCYGAILVDPGEPAYQAHLLEQVRRNNELLPAVDGICIDRTDWLTEYNPNGDDGVSWVNGKPARSLFRSWQGLMDKMCPLLHAKNKVVFGNNCAQRLDVAARLDGIYSENTQHPFLNFSALLGMRKPTTIWAGPDHLPSDDALQRHLYLGVFSTAPYPYNNHCLGASPGADALFLAYGPLFNAIRGRKWVLAPHCVESVTAKVNLFEVPGGYALPVTLGGTAESATVRLKNLPGLDTLKAEALHPGAESATPVKTEFKDGALTLTVPLKRGCAMVKLNAKQ